MAFHLRFRVFFGAGLALVAVVGTCIAGPSDYRIELIDKSVKAGTGAIIRIRVINISSKKTVADADIQVKALDMSPDGMADMSAKTVPMESNNAELHEFKADLVMPGRWALSVEATIPGESTSLRDKVLLRVQR
jgi:hypothetical protein